MILNEQRLILAGCRIAPPANAWQMPQGGCEPGETEVEAALRELGEETGILSAEILRESREVYRYDFLPHHRQDRWRGQAQRWFALRFLGDPDSINLQAVPQPEFSHHDWLTPEEMLRRIVDFKRPVYEAVFREFADLLATAP